MLIRKIQTFRSASSSTDLGLWVAGDWWHQIITLIGTGLISHNKSRIFCDSNKPSSPVLTLKDSFPLKTLFQLTIAMLVICRALVSILELKLPSLIALIIIFILAHLSKFLQVLSSIIKNWYCEDPPWLSCLCPWSLTHAYYILASTKRNHF
jgi:hypothetical protein